MGTNYYLVSRKPTLREPLHIGKSSCGWKFLFHEINKGDCSYDYDLELHNYEQWIRYLRKNKNEYLILDEYDEEISVRQFKHLVSAKQNEENPENFKYCKNVNGYRFVEGEFS